MSRIEKLFFAKGVALESSVSSLKMIYSEEAEKYYQIPFFEDNNVICALSDIYIDNDFNAARQHFYNAASIALHMSKKYDWRVMDNGTFQISYALLSDNKALIESYSTLKNKVNHETSLGFQLANAIQNILLENWNSLDINIQYVKRLTAVDKLRFFAPCADVFESFRSKDPVKLEQALLTLIKDHPKRMKNGLTSEFMSSDTCAYCKLAWIKGYEIDLKTNLVPIKLMAVKPLENYETYDFLL